MAQVETLRKMLLAMATDMRVVLVRLASCVTTLRYFAEQKRFDDLTRNYGREVLDLYAPLANRLGIFQLKWELEDLSFRMIEPETYKRIAKMLEEKRMLREELRRVLDRAPAAELAAAGIKAEVSGRPKHIYSIWKKMRGKELDFTELYDVRAFRVIVADAKTCYTVLGLVHNIWTPIPKRIRRLHLAPEAERLPVAAHGRHRRRRAPARSADPHPGDAQLRRVRRGRALALQGRGRLELQEPAVRREDRLAAPAAGLEERRGRRRPWPARRSCRRNGSRSSRPPRSTTASSC
jgi:hypothetical protein